MSIMLDSIIVAEQMYVGPRESLSSLHHARVPSHSEPCPVLFEISARRGFIGRYHLQKVI